MKNKLLICLSLILSLQFIGCLSDRSAVVHAEGLSWNVKSYSTVTGKYTEGKTIAKNTVCFEISKHYIPVLEKYID